MTQAELKQQLDGIKSQLDKAKSEIVANVAALQEAITNAGNMTPEVEEALNNLKSSAQALDDLNPDAPPPAEG